MPVGLYSKKVAPFLFIEYNFTSIEKSTKWETIHINYFPEDKIELSTNIVTSKLFFSYKPLVNNKIRNRVNVWNPVASSWKK